MRVVIVGAGGEEDEVVEVEGAGVVEVVVGAVIIIMEVDEERAVLVDGEAVTIAVELRTPSEMLVYVQGPAKVEEGELTSHTLTDITWDTAPASNLTPARRISRCTSRDRTSARRTARTASNGPEPGVLYCHTSLARRTTAVRIPNVEAVVRPLWT